MKRRLIGIALGWVLGGVIAAFAADATAAGGITTTPGATSAGGAMAAGEATSAGGAVAVASNASAAGIHAAASTATTSAAASLDETEIAALFTQANALFHQANQQAAAHSGQSRELYRRALLRYERIVRDGAVHNGRLYYDIGNTYFRLQDIGRAILNYRRAQHFIPNDENLIQNLHYARSRRVDQIDERQQARILKTLFFWHYDLAGRTRSQVFVVGFVLFWVLASVRLLAPRFAPRWALVLTGILTVLCLSSLAVDAHARISHRPGVIVEPEVVARKGDSETYEPSFKEPLHAGTEFHLLQARDGWYRIQLADGRGCWIPSLSAEMLW